MLTQIQAVIHLRYPYGTSLAPQPPSCWQSPRRIFTNQTRCWTQGYIVQRASHNAITGIARRCRLHTVARAVTGNDETAVVQ